MQIDSSGAGRAPVLIAAFASLIWIGLSLLWLFTSTDISWYAGAVLLVGPLMAIWGLALVAQGLSNLIDEIRALRLSVETLPQSSGTNKAESNVIASLDAFAATQRKVETTLAMLAAAPRRDDSAYGLVSADEERAVETRADMTQHTPDDQHSLPLSPTREPDPLSTEDYIRALNFPQTADDQAGFAALRRAMRDREAKHLVQAAQDVLTLLSQDGVYMDDLEPSRARPELWRRFASGERGPNIATLAAIGEESTLMATANRMRSDTIFRDTVHHFLRRFDRGLAKFSGMATDGEIAALADTRTARAFMLLGRVAGTFD